METPQPFLEVRVNVSLTESEKLVGICAGYEEGRWRSSELVNHVFEWIPEFALRSGELSKLGVHNMVPLMRRAVSVIYQTEKFQKRGEIGELLLHIALRQVFGTIPAISKMYFKDGPNETVKGFDAVHIVEAKEGLELWLGEVKFYDAISQAIGDVLKELESHTNRKYLRNEFAAIINKIDDHSKYAGSLKELLNPNTSLDKIFVRTRIPILLTYDSSVVQKHSIVSKAFEKELETELKAHGDNFQKKKSDCPILVHLILFPMKKKKELVNLFEKEIRKWQPTSTKKSKA